MAVTVDDQIQHLGYWTMYFNMKEKVATFERLISTLHRYGIRLIDFNYELFTLRLSVDQAGLAESVMEMSKTSLLLDGYYQSYPDETSLIVHLEFAS